MITTTSKPWSAVYWLAAAVPTAGYVGLLVGDAFACGRDHAGLMAIFSVILAVPIILLGAGVATAALSFWRGPFSLRGWRIACSVVALGAGLAGGAFVLHGLHDPHLCHIDL
jgi:hypothetical protein